MSEHPNAVRARQGMEAFARGDIDGLQQFIDEDVVWHQGGRTALKGEYRGRDQVFELFGRILELTGGTYNLEPIDILASDGYLVIFLKETASRDGRSLDVTRVVAITVTPEGRLSEYFSLVDDQEAEDAFFA